MNDSSELDQQLWELVYGLLPAEEARALQQKIRSDRDLARKYAEVCLQADLVANASKLVAPAAELTVAAIDPTAATSASGKSNKGTPSQKPGNQVQKQSSANATRWIDRGLLALAASLMLVMVGSGIYANRPADQTALAMQFPVFSLTTDRPLIEAVSSQVKVSVTDALGNPLTRRATATIVQKDGRTIQAPAVSAADAAPAERFQLAGSAIQPGTTLHLEVEGLPPKDVPLAVTPNPVQDFLVLEKPLASPGETVNYFVYGRRTIGGEISPPSAEKIQLFGLKEGVVDQPLAAKADDFDRKAKTSDQAFVTGKFTVPPQSELGIAAVALGDGAGLSYAEESLLIVPPESQQLALRSSGDPSLAKAEGLKAMDDKATKLAMGGSASRMMRRSAPTDLAQADSSKAKDAARSAPLAATLEDKVAQRSTIPAPPKAVDSDSNLPAKAMKKMEAPTPSADAPPPAPAAAPGAAAIASRTSRPRALMAPGGMPTQGMAKAGPGIPGSGIPSGSGSAPQAAVAASEKSKLEKADAGAEMSAAGKPMAAASALAVAPSDLGKGLGGPTEASGKQSLGVMAGALQKQQESVELQRSNQFFATDPNSYRGLQESGLGAPSFARWNDAEEAQIIFRLPPAIAESTSAIQIDVSSNGQVVASQVVDPRAAKHGELAIKVPAEVQPPLVAEFFDAAHGNTAQWKVEVSRETAEASSLFRFGGIQSSYTPGQAVELTVEPPQNVKPSEVTLLGIQVVQTELLADHFQFQPDTSLANFGRLSKFNKEQWSKGSGNEFGSVDNRRAGAKEGLELDSVGEEVSEGAEKKLAQSFSGGLGGAGPSPADKSEIDRFAAMPQTPVLLLSNQQEAQAALSRALDKQTQAMTLARNILAGCSSVLALVFIGLVVRRWATTSASSTQQWRSNVAVSGLGFVSVCVLLVIAGVQLQLFPTGNKTVAMGVTPDAASPPSGPAPMNRSDVLNQPREEANALPRDAVASPRFQENRLAEQSSEPLMESPAEPSTKRESLSREDGTDALPLAKTGNDFDIPAADNAVEKEKLASQPPVPLSLLWMTEFDYSQARGVPVKFTLPEQEADYTLIIHAIENGQLVTQQIPITSRKPVVAAEAAPVAEEPAPAAPVPAEEAKPAEQPK